MNINNLPPIDVLTSDRTMLFNIMYACDGYTYENTVIHMRNLVTKELGVNHFEPYKF